MMVLLHDLKNFLKEISITEIKHLDPVRVRIYIQGLIDSEERRMTDYKTGVMPSLVKELNDLLDLVNDIEADRDEWKNYPQRGLSAKPDSAYIRHLDAR